MIKHLNRNLNRRVQRYTTRMLNGGRRPAGPNYLSIACRLLTKYVRWRERTRKQWAVRERECRLMLEQYEREQMFDAAMKKVYGSTASSDLRSPPSAL